MSRAQPGIPTAMLNRRGVLAVALMCATASIVQAAPAIAPVASPPVHIVVIGDSLAEGVWGSLYRRFYRTRAIRVVNAAAASTGFNRTPYEDTLRDVLSRHPIDLLVMLTGANDAQGAWGLDGGAPAAFATESWRSLYERRIRRFLDPVREHGLNLIWLGLPVMGSPGFESRIARVRAVHRELCTEYTVPYFDLAAITKDAEGAYTNVRQDDAGRARLLRFEDGVHFTEYGNDVIGEMILYYVLDSRPPWLTPEIEQIILPPARS
jgi:hypothetical protein